MDRKLWTTPYDARIVAEGVQLARDEVVGIRDGRGALVFVESGTAWITQEGDRRDVLVPAGDSFRLDRAGVALVQACRAGTITVTAPLDDGEPQLFRSAPVAYTVRSRHRGHPLVRHMWAIVLRLYRRHARPRPWDIRMEPERAASFPFRLLDPVGPGPRVVRDPAAGLRDAIALDMTRCA